MRYIHERCSHGSSPTASKTQPRRAEMNVAETGWKAGPRGGAVVGERGRVVDSEARDDVLGAVDDDVVAELAR